METITLEEHWTSSTAQKTGHVRREEEITVTVGRFGPYIRHDNKFIFDTRKGVDPSTVSLRNAFS